MNVYSQNVNSYVYCCGVVCSYEKLGQNWDVCHIIISMKYDIWLYDCEMLPPPFETLNATKLCQHCYLIGWTRLVCFCHYYLWGSWWCRTRGGRTWLIKMTEVTLIFDLRYCKVESFLAFSMTSWPQPWILIRKLGSHLSKSRESWSVEIRKID